MPIIKVLKILVAAIFSIIGLIGLYQMFHAEVNTAHQFHFYFKWALGAGIVFIAVGAALTALDKDDDVVTEYVDEKAK